MSPVHSESKCVAFPGTMSLITTNHSSKQSDSFDFGSGLDNNSLFSSDSGEAVSLLLTLLTQNVLDA